MKCVHLTSAHRYDDVRIYHKECVSLANAGHDVHLVVPSMIHEDGDRTEDGICIHPVPTPSSRKERFLKTSLHVFNRARRLDADIFHLHDPELLPYGVALRLLGNTVVYDVHEDVSADISSREWIPKKYRTLVSQTFRFAEFASLMVMSGVVVVTDAIRAKFRRVRPPRLLLKNYPILSELEVPGSTVPYSDREDQAVYVGSITEVRGIYEMLQAVDILQKSGRQARLALAGSFFPSSLETAVRSTGEWGSVDFHGWADRSEVAQMLGASKVGLVVLHPTPNMGEALPVKLFEYMSAGIPVIASDFPLWRSIVEDADCGILVDPKDPDAIADAMRWMYDHPEEAEAMGQRGREAVLRTYNWSNEEEKLLTFYASLVD